MATFPGATIDECQGKKVIRTKICQDVGEELQIQGEFTPSGLRTDLKVTNFTVGDTAVPLPASALTNRNSMIIYNKSATDILFIGKSDVANSGANEGWEIDPGTYFSLDITDDIVIYGIAPAGQTISVKTLELA